MSDTRAEALRRLDPLVGRWEATIHHAQLPGRAVRVELDCTWQDGVFLVLRTVADAPEFPDTVSVVGADDSTDRYGVCYSDDRGVHRLYQMELADGVWRQWRDVPGFAQRFTGRFSADGNTIAAAWELCRDGETWDHDFDVTYHRLTGG